MYDGLRKILLTARHHFITSGAYSGGVEDKFIENRSVADKCNINVIFSVIASVPVHCCYHKP